MNDLFMTFISRLKVDAKCVYQQWNWITVANYFGTPPADWVHGYLYFEPGAWIWTKGFRRYLHIVKNWSGRFSLNSSRVHALGRPLLGIFSGFFWFFLGGSVGQIIYREYIVFRGSNISCSLARATHVDSVWKQWLFQPLLLKTHEAWCYRSRDVAVSFSLSLSLFLFFTKLSKLLLPIRSSRAKFQGSRLYHFCSKKIIGDHFYQLLTFFGGVAFGV